MNLFANAFAQAVDHIHDVVAAPKIIQEPVVTWNLFLTAFLVPVCSAITAGLVIAYINWRMKKQAKIDEEIALKKVEKEAEIARLRIELEQEKMEATKAWRETHTSTLCRVKEKVDGIYEALDNKVNKDDCDRLMRRGDERVVL